MRRLSLTRMCFEARANNPRHAFPDDPCPESACRGKLYVYDSRTNQLGQRVRYLKCNCCGKCPENNKWIA